uniref:Elongation factor G, mitochondrial n=1 Tax=Lygus hesperus TaxID=30085 RepID=A0A0A9Z2R2_LYGHE
MDSMELEREKGITIQSAATYIQWNKDKWINIIDTPGHVDFTVEVERALRVLDGAILVICAVSGVQSQSITVDRQMKRYNIPRLVFINKIDRQGANPQKAIEALEKTLRLNTVPLQVPMGLEKEFRGVIDIVERCAIYYDGANGEVVRIEKTYPDEYTSIVERKRLEFVEKLAEFDDTVADMYLQEMDIDTELLYNTLRR